MNATTLTAIREDRERRRHYLAGRTAHVREYVEADGGCRWEVLVEGVMLVETHDRALLSGLEHDLGMNVQWVTDAAL